MSAAAQGAKNPRRKLLQAVILAVIGALLFGVTRLSPDPHGGASTVASIGFLLLSGTLASELVAGPHVLRLIDRHSVERLSSINALALALIALEGGAELKASFLKKGLKSL